MAGLPRAQRPFSKAALAQKARAEWAEKCRAIFVRDGWVHTGKITGNPWLDFIRYQCPRCPPKKNGLPGYTLYYGSIQAKVKHEEWHDKGAKTPLKKWDPKMKWNIDKLITKLENAGPVTSFERVLLNLEQLARENVTPTLEQKGIGHAYVWRLAVGSTSQKVYFFGQEMRECFLKARRAAKQGKLEEVLPGAKARFTARGRGPAAKRRGDRPERRPSADPG